MMSPSRRDTSSRGGRTWWLGIFVAAALAPGAGGRETFTIRDGELVLTPDHRPANPDRFYVRVYGEWSLDRRKPSMALFDSRAKPPLVVQYYR